MQHLLGRALAASVALSALLAGPAAALESESPPGSNVPLTFSPPVVSPGFAGLAIPAASVFPDRPSAPEIDGYGTQDEEFHCDPTAKPGTVALAEMVGAALQTEWGIERACGAGGYGTSRHKMGLAIDVMLDSGTEDGRAKADTLIGWLLAPDAAGNPNARARRLGVTQIIWSDRIWQATREADHGLTSDISTWSEYHHPTGCASDTCRHRDHVHLSLSVAGGAEQTTWWTYVPPPAPAPTPDPVPAADAPAPAPETPEATTPAPPTAVTSTTAPPATRDPADPPAASRRAKASLETRADRELHVLEELVEAWRAALDGED